MEIDARQLLADRHRAGNRDNAFGGIRAFTVLVDTADYVHTEVDTRQGLLSKV